MTVKTERRIQHAAPRDLAALFDVFETLERGVSVALGDGGKARVPDLPEVGGPCLGLSSSGTTGPARMRWHGWPGLRAGAVGGMAYRGWVWASPFRPDTFAGVQVALQAWVGGGVVRSLSTDWLAPWESLRRWRPDAICATPTYLDLLSTAEATSGSAEGEWVPRQITLGGEPLRESVGRRLGARFPRTRFTVVYASTEAGLIAKTRRLDGWFETGDLVSGWEDWRVRHGELQLARNGEWTGTGDRAEGVEGVEGVEGRFRVLGRISAVANVGGTKVWLSEVEALAETVEGVRMARAVAARNSVTGEVVALRFVLADGADGERTRAELERRIRAGLPKPAWPRSWEEVGASLGPNAKKGLA